MEIIDKQRHDHKKKWYQKKSYTLYLLIKDLENRKFILFVGSDGRTLIEGVPPAINTLKEAFKWRNYQQYQLDC